MCFLFFYWKHLAGQIKPYGRTNISPQAPLLAALAWSKKMAQKYENSSSKYPSAESGIFELLHLSKKSLCTLINDSFSHLRSWNQQMLDISAWQINSLSWIQIPDV